jgi:iron complex transport system permease protein
VSPARRWAVGGALTVVVLAAAAMLVGPGQISAPQVLSAIGRGLVGSSRADDLVDAQVWLLRVPRVLVVALVGAALAGGGAVTQGLFRNPLADPSVLGISLGAAFVAVVGIFLGLDRAGIWMTPVLAALGAGATLGVLLGLATRSGDSTTLLLAGVALGATFGAATTCVLALAGDRHELGIKVLRWLMGSFEGRSWGHLAVATAPIGAGLALAVALARDLDALALGDDVAASLGVSPRSVQRRAVTAVALLVGGATAVAGVLGFLGLVVPHVVRWRLGLGHRSLLPISALVGASTLLAVDTLTRVAPVAMPPGIVTSLIGAPAFLWILLAQRTRRPT